MADVRRDANWGLQDHSDREPTYSIDPVCGMKVDEAHAPGGRVHYAGHTFYFCSDSCRKNFEEFPAKYMGQRTRL